MDHDDMSYYERIAIEFAEWISLNKYKLDSEDYWWDISTNKIIAESTADLLHIFKTQ